MNQNQPITMDLEDVQAVMPHPSTVWTGPRDVSGENDKGGSAATHEVSAHVAAYNTDSC